MAVDPLNPITFRVRDEGVDLSEDTTIEDPSSIKDPEAFKQYLSIKAEMDQLAQSQDTHDKMCKILDLQRRGKSLAQQAGIFSPAIEARFKTVYDRAQTVPQWSYPNMPPLSYQGLASPRPVHYDTFGSLIRDCFDNMLGVLDSPGDSFDVYLRQFLQATGTYLKMFDGCIGQDPLAQGLKNWRAALPTYIQFSVKRAEFLASLGGSSKESLRLFEEACNEAKNLTRAQNDDLEYLENKIKKMRETLKSGTSRITFEGIITEWINETF